MAVQATYALYVDWNDDGDFGDSGEDITSDMMTATIRRGYSRPLSRLPRVGRATFLLDNSSKDYSPPNAATVLPRREVKLDMTYGGSTETLFRGFIEEIRPDFGTSRSRRVVLECVDAMALLDLYEGELAIQTDVYADTIIQAVVAQCYTPPATNYQEGVNLFPTSADRWAWKGATGSAHSIMLGPTEVVRGSDKIMDACTGDWGRFFISREGTPTFFNRHQMPLDTTTDLTLTNTMVNMDYQKAAGDVFNYVEVTCHPRAIGETYEVLGRISQDQAPRIEASDNELFVIHFRDAVDASIKIGGKSVVKPVATTDFACTSDPEGEGDDKTSDVTSTMTAFGDHAEITLTNADTDPVFVQKLQVRGLAVRAREPITVVAQDATSIASYQKRKLPINAPMMNLQGEAQALADYLVLVYKDPLDDVRGVEFIANVNATLIAAARDLDLMDRVVLTETQTALSSYAGYIYSMTHIIESKWEHRVILDLESAYSVGTPFELDNSALNSGHVLIY